jgi:hypothetical protein
MTISEYNQPSLIPTEHELCVFQTMAKQAVASKMYRGIGDESGVMMIMLTARELGIPAMQALNGAINIIQGKVELSARLMNALMRRAGISISMKEMTPEKCTLIGKRGNDDTMTASYTMEDAKKAGLIKPGGGWVKNPEDMLFARAISRLARRIAPDIIGGCYVEGEIQDAINVHVEPISENYEPVEKVTTTVLLNKFPEEDHGIVMEYLNLVAKHFNKTENEAVEYCLKEPLIIEKVATFKAKRAKNENSG